MQHDEARPVRPDLKATPVRQSHPTVSSRRGRHRLPSASLWRGFRPVHRRRTSATGRSRCRRVGLEDGATAADSPLERHPVQDTALNSERAARIRPVGRTTGKRVQQGKPRPVGVDLEDRAVAKAPPSAVSPNSTPHRGSDNHRGPRHQSRRRKRVKHGKSRSVGVDPEDGAVITGTAMGGHPE